MTATESLTTRMDALAAALTAAGVDTDRVASILGSAATATMNALLLDAVLEENQRLQTVCTANGLRELPLVVPVEPAPALAA